MFWEKKSRDDYSVGDVVYSDKTGIYRKMYQNKYVIHKTTEVFTSGAVQFQRDQLNKHIKIICPEPHFR